MEGIAAALMNSVWRVTGIMMWTKSTGMIQCLFRLRFVLQSEKLWTEALKFKIFVPCAGM